jgi:hypothetical protein
MKPKQAKPVKPNKLQVLKDVITSGIEAIADSVTSFIFTDSPEEAELLRASGKVRDKAVQNRGRNIERSACHWYTYNGQTTVLCYACN